MTVDIDHYLTVEEATATILRHILTGVKEKDSSDKNPEIVFALESLEARKRNEAPPALVFGRRLAEQSASQPVMKPSDSEIANMLLVLRAKEAQYSPMVAAILAIGRAVHRHPRPG